MSNGHKFRGRELDITVIVTKFFCLFSLSCYFSSSSDTDSTTDDEDIACGKALADALRFIF
jgi:hypothetical protein